MAKLTNVSCEYTGGGIYVYTALLNDDVWFTTDFQTYDSYGCYDAPLDVVEADILPDGSINYAGHWKNPSYPLPQWIDILYSINGMKYTFEEVYKQLPANAYCRVGEKELTTDPNTERLETIGSFIDIFEDFLEEKGIDIPNDEKDDSDNPAIIYGTDYGNLSDQIESLLVRLGVLN